MKNNSNCESYPNCRNCNKWLNCWITGSINAPNPLLNIEVDKYNNIYKSNPINYASDDLGVDNVVLNLIKWEVESRKKHNSNPNRMTTKPIDLLKIINWYNDKFYSNVSLGEVQQFLKGVLSEL